MLVDDGILNADFTPNEQTAARWGRELSDPDVDSVAAVVRLPLAPPPFTDTSALQRARCLLTVATCVLVALVRPAESSTRSSQVGQVPVVSSNDFYQEIEYDYAGDHVVIHNHERASPTEWEDSFYECSSSFSVDAVTARQSNEIYVAGTSSSGDNVIERWMLSTPDGGRFYSRAISVAPSGRPLRGIPVVRAGVVGGTYVRVADRQAVPREVRTELYRGALLGGIVAITCDPEGRFLLIVSTTGKLFRLPIRVDANPEQLYDARALPALVGAVAICPLQHATQGRIYLLEGRSLGATTDTVLIDSNNDGLFESVQTYTHPQYVANGFEGSVWVTDFINDFR